jgi:hypothetical protein
MVASRLLVTSASMAGRGSEREGREREDTTQSPSGESERVLEASVDNFGGETENPLDASPVVNDGRRFFRSGGTRAA